MTAAVAPPLLVERVATAELTIHPRNSRQGDVGAICESLEAHGQYRPIVAQTATRHVLAGNHTLLAARALGWPEIDVTWLDVDDDQALRVLLVDNRTNDLATYDDSALTALLVELASGPKGLDGTGYDGDALDDLLASLAGPKPGLTDPDAVPDWGQARTKPGDLWVMGEHRLLCGDMTTDAARFLTEPVDIVFTDPPYGISYLPQNAKLAAKGKLKGDARDEYGEWDTFAATVDGWCRSVLDQLRDGGCYYVCMGWEHLGHVVESFRGAGHLPYTVITWDRVSPRLTPFPQDYIPVNEFIVYGWRHGKRRGNGADGTQQTTIWRFQTMRAKDMEHTTQKPVELVANVLLNSSYPHEHVYDPFGGSGTTLIAAEQTNRRASLIEIDPHYCDVIVERWEQYTGKTAELAA